MQKTIKGKRIRISNESREFVHWKENALVRANYNDLKNGVHETTEYLELFLRNLLLDEKNELHNRTMHISGRFAEVDIERVRKTTWYFIFGKNENYFKGKPVERQGRKARRD